MKVFITGHMGFIGSHLTKRLDAEGIEWVGFDLKKHDDIRNEIGLDQAMRSCAGGVVIHLAALAGVRDGEQRPGEYLSTNVVGTQNVINSVKNHRMAHLISFSSSSVLGLNTPPAEGNTEGEATKPIAVYGLSKECAEKLVQHAKLPSSIIRPFTVYGENGRPNQVIYKWINCIKAGQKIPFFGDGNTKRGYTYVGDLVDGLVKMVREIEKGGLYHEKFPVQVYNMGGAEIITLNDLLELFKEVAGDFEIDRMELPKGDVPENWANCTKARNAFGFDNKTKFREKVTEIIKTEMGI